MAQLRLGRGGIFEKRCLDDFELEARQQEPGRAYGFDEPLDKPGLSELRWRDVDAERETWPSQRIAAGALQHPGAEVVGKAMRLDRKEEILRPNRASHRMLP